MNVIGSGGGDGASGGGGGFRAKSLINKKVKIRSVKTGQLLHYFGGKPKILVKS